MVNIARRLFGLDKPKTEEKTVKRMSPREFRTKYFKEESSKSEEE